MHTLGKIDRGVSPFRSSKDEEWRRIMLLHFFSKRKREKIKVVVEVKRDPCPFLSYTHASPSPIQRLSLHRSSYPYLVWLVVKRSTSSFTITSGLSSSIPPASRRNALWMIEEMIKINSLICNSYTPHLQLRARYYFCRCITRLHGFSSGGLVGCEMFDLFFHDY